MNKTEFDCLETQPGARRDMIKRRTAKNNVLSFAIYYFNNVPLAKRIAVAANAACRNTWQTLALKSNNEPNQTSAGTRISNRSPLLLFLFDAVQTLPFRYVRVHSSPSPVSQARVRSTKTVRKYCGRARPPPIHEESSNVLLEQLMFVFFIIIVVRKNKITFHANKIKK